MPPLPSLDTCFKIGSCYLGQAGLQHTATLLHRFPKCKRLQSCDTMSSCVTCMCVFSEVRGPVSYYITAHFIPFRQSLSLNLELTDGQPPEEPQQDSCLLHPHNAGVIARHPAFYTGAEIPAQMQRVLQQVLLPTASSLHPPVEHL